MTNSLYNDFFSVFGECLHFDLHYNSYTKNETINTSGEIAQLLFMKLVKATETIVGLFRYVSEDFKNEKLSKEDFGKYMRYYNLLLCDTITVKQLLTKNSELINAIKSYASKYSKFKDL